MNSDTNRLLLGYEQLLKAINREVINPEINVISLADLRPIAGLVARARASYLKRLYEIAQSHDNSKTLPNDSEITELKQLRSVFLELVEGSKSIETAIQRGYLDISGD